MSNFKVEKRPELIGFSVVHVRIPRDFVLKCRQSQELTPHQIRLLFKISERLERKINSLRHVASIVDEILLLHDSNLKDS